MSQVNFVAEMRAIMDRCRKECLGANERLLWIALFWLANDRARENESNAWDWPDDFFPVNNAELCIHCPLEKRKVLEARNRLKQLGVIDFKPGKNNMDAPRFKMFYQSSMQRCNNAPLERTATVPAFVPHTVTATVPDAVPINVNPKDIYITNKHNDNDNQGAVADAIRKDHDEIFALWESCGWTLNARHIEILVAHYSTYGKEKLLDAIRQTSDASAKQPIKYLQAVLEAKPRTSGSRGYSNQRDYSNDTSDMDRMMGITHEHGFPERVYHDETDEIIKRMMEMDEEGKV